MVGVEGVETVKSPPLGCVDCGTPTPGLGLASLDKAGRGSRKGNWA